ncbi:MAG: hypothetical protein KJZ65_10950 [Phycisphaerales bacterium]|nr:hypothetical protein [Phycisphaerales bacterium]
MRLVGRGQDPDAIERAASIVKARRTEHPADLGGGLIQLGFNGAGQSAPTYLRSDPCEEPDFVNLATLGFRGRHLVMSLGVRQATAATILVGGLEYQSLGGAALNLSGQTLQVAGDPVNGPWGVSIPLGSTSMGAESPGSVWDGSAGSGVAINFNSASTTDSMTLMGTSDVEATLLADFAEPLQDTFDVRVLSGGQVVGVFPNQTSGSVRLIPESRFRIGSLHVWCKTIKIETPDFIYTERSYGAEFEGNITFMAGPVSASGDGMVVVPHLVGPGEMFPPIDIEIVALNLSSIDLLPLEFPVGIGFGDASSLPKLPPPRHSTVGVFGSALPTSESIHLQGVDSDADGLPDLQLQNIGSTGQDGIRLAWGGVESASTEIWIDPSVGVPPCAEFRSIQLGGGPGGTVLLDPDPQFPDWLALVPNFNGVGAGTYRLQVFDHGNLVWSQGGLTGQALASHSWPWKFGKLGGQTPCLQMCYPHGTDLFISAAGVVVVGDDVRLLAEGAPPFELIEAFEIRGINLDEMVLSKPTSVLSPLPCRADINGDGVLNFFDVLQWLNLFSSQQPGGDFNNDGQFNFFDVQSFLNAFSSGCP